MKIKLKIKLKINTIVFRGMALYLLIEICPFPVSFGDFPAARVDRKADLGSSVHYWPPAVLRFG